MTLATEAIHDYVSSDVKRTVTLSYIVNIVADHFLDCSGRSAVIVANQRITKNSLLRFLPKQAVALINLHYMFPSS